MKQNRIFQVSPDIDDSDIESVSEYLNSGGWLTEHKVTENLNLEIKSFVKREHALCVPSGTIALYLALLASGVVEGKRVAVPNLTMIATINSVLWAKAEPVLVDVDETLCMSYEKLIELKNIDAVMFVPLNGRTGAGEKIEKWCKDNDIILIEDSAHALGSNYKSKECGSLGDLSIFSFTPHKIITMGQGGMVLTDNDTYQQNIFEIKTFNRAVDKLDWHKGFGLNFKITDIQAALGLSQFSKIQKYIDRKRKNWDLYSNLIDSDMAEFLPFKEYETPWFFDIIFKTVKDKERVASELEKNNIETRNSYPALSFQEYLKDIEKGELTLSESISDKILWLPSSNNLEESDIIEISNIVNSCF